MSDMIAWIAAEAEQPGLKPNTGFPWRRRKDERTEEVPVQELPAHQFGGSSPAVTESAKDVEPSAEERVAQMVDACDEIREV
jgi:hypothetical protein